MAYPPGLPLGTEISTHLAGQRVETRDGEGVCAYKRWGDGTRPPSRGGRGHTEMPTLVGVSIPASREGTVLWDGNNSLKCSVA